MVASTSSFFLAVMMLSLWGKVVVVDCLLSIGLNLCVFSYNAEYRNAVVTITWINLFHLQPIHFFSTVWRGKKKCAVWRMLEDLLDSATPSSRVVLAFWVVSLSNTNHNLSKIIVPSFAIFFLNACMQKKKKKSKTYQPILLFCVCVLLVMFRKPQAFFLYILIWPRDWRCMY